MSVADLTGTTWFFNSTLTWSPLSGIEYSFGLSFNSNGVDYNSMLLSANRGQTATNKILYITTGPSSVPAFEAQSWTSDAYRTISITGGIAVTNATIISWLEANATQVTPSGNVLVSYKGETIAAFSGTTKTLTTAGKYLEADILVTDNAGTVTLQDKTTTPTQSTQTITADSGYTGLGTVTVNPIPQNYGLITYNGSTITVS